MIQKAFQKEAFSPLLIEDLPDIVRGHEIWIEYDMHNFSPGDPIACDLCFGHNMKSDKAVKTEKVTTAVFGTWEKNSAVEVSAAENHLLMRFTPVVEGYHTIGVEYDGGILNLPHPGLEGPNYYQQYTKTIIPVGDCQAEYDLIIGQELEIIPLSYRRYKVGEHILLKVLYDQRPLPDVTVYGIHIDNHNSPIEVMTDQEGIVEIELEKSGKWMFKVGHRDPEKSSKCLYNKKVMTATFTIMDIGRENVWK